MDPRGYLEERLKQDRDRILALVQDLVRVPSENPPGDTTRVFAYVADYLEKRGLDYEVVAPQPTMPNLIAAYAGGEPGKHLVLNGHLDVFPAGDPSTWSGDPYSGAVRDGKLFGRGVIDMKVGTAASILTYVYLSGVRQRLRGKLTLTVVSDEETFGPWGARYLLANRPEVRGDCLLNGEPSTPQTIRFGEKGLLWLDLEVRTKGGHGGSPHLSPNAITVSASIIGELAELGSIVVETPPGVAEKIAAAGTILDEQIGPGTTQVLQHVTVNIGTIDGGLKLNMIAPTCRTAVDLRCPVGVSTKAVLEQFERILERHRAVGEITYKIVNRTEPYTCDPNHPMVQIVQDNAERVRGIRPVPIVSLGGTDARLWRQAGIPAYVYGPSPHNMGAPDEHATLDDLFGTVWVHVLSAYDYLAG
jgi:succinyl-diaminopimelate desuccinylase